MLYKITINNTTMANRWAKAFYGSFKDIYDSDKDALEEKWDYHGSIFNGDDLGCNVTGLLTDIPMYTAKCMCGHGILENCIVSNGKYSCVVGSCCVKKFMPKSKREIARRKTNKVMVRKLGKKIIKKHLQNVTDRQSIIINCQEKNPTFGKYKEITWENVPNSYLKWCMKAGVRFSPQISQYVKIRLQYTYQ